MARRIASSPSEASATTGTPRDGKFKVVGALQVLIAEEWAHDRFAERDLAKLEAQAGGV